MKVTILICTYNRGNLIHGTLKSIIKDQTRKPDQIVIVDGGGENSCRVTLNYWKAEFDSIIVIETINKNLSASRNVGLPYCYGEIIMQTDDDARPFPDWIERMVEFHKKFPDVGVIGGNVIDGSSRSFLSKVADATTFPNFESNQYVRSVPGVNSSYKKEVILKVGKYDESLFRGEDVDYNWRAQLNGWKILHVPTIKVNHIHRSTWKGLFNQHFMYGRAHFLVRSKWPDMYSHYPTKVCSLTSFIKWILSWNLIPILDAMRKASRVNRPVTGFEILILFLINLSNRIGSSLEKNKKLLNLI